MSTSRTGTATWKRARAQALAKAKRMGVTHCRHCRVALTYDTGLQPNSAVPDHVVPWSMGGRDHVDNLEVICRKCNESKGNRAVPKAENKVVPIKTSRKW